MTYNISELNVGDFLQVSHVVQNGCVNFYVYSTKVIPRGSEITIPYDYNYKDW